MAKLSFSFFSLSYNYLGGIMKKYYQIIGLLGIMFLSFYYTERIANIVLNKRPLMIKINEEKDNYKIESVSAVIEGDYIIPGLFGREVNVKDSYYKMQRIDAFNKYYLVYEDIKPEVSIEDNKDKIIRKGNPKLSQVALVFEGESNLTNYLKSENIKASLLVDLKTYQKNSYFEQINNDLNNFKALENNLNLNKENKHVCVLNSNIKEICIKYHNYLVEPLLVFNNNNLIDIKNKIDKGSIILVKDNVSLDSLKLIIREINFKDLKMVYLSDLIREDYLNN